jgi:hypothetical protein
MKDGGVPFDRNKNIKGATINLGTVPIFEERKWDCPPCESRVMNKNILLGGCFLIFLVLAVGCGKRAPVHEANRGPVSGSLSLDGKPLPGGTIGFISVKDPRYCVTAMIQTDGTFRVADAPTGEVKISVDTESARIGNPSAYFPVPAKYRNANTSGLTATINKDGSEPTKLTFDLKSK